MMIANLKLILRLGVIASGLMVAGTAVAAAADGAGAQKVDKEVQSSEKDEQGSPDARCKKLFGKKSIAIDGLGFCARFDGAVWGVGGYDFTDEDLQFVGHRNSASSMFPFLFYGKRDVSDDTDSGNIGLGAEARFTFIEATTDDPLIGVLALQLATEGDLSSVNSILDENTGYYDGSINIYPGIIQQAWLRKGPVTAGIQPSKFDFMLSGFSFYPGYATKESLLSFVITHKFNKSVSMSVALEDGSQRQRDDGVLANYGDNLIVDPVILLRARQGNAVYHLSAAAHRAVWEGGAFNMPDGEQWGGAVRAGFLYDMNGDGKNSSDSWLRGRFMLSAAYARGALDYLNVPDFVVDYIAEQDGDLGLSEGLSAVASYEYPITESLRAIATASGYYANMGASGNILGNTSITDVSYDVDVYGAKFQFAMEKFLSNGALLGAEVAYQADRVDGEFNGYDYDEESVSYPSVKAYVAWRF